jgi:hypothetical protein
MKASLDSEAQLRWRQHWWGMWVIDWFTCDRDENFASSAWLSFDLWAKAYRKINPELEKHSDLDLIENHYTEAMDIVFDSWVFSIWQLLQLPTTLVHQLIWQIKVKFFREF